MAAAEGSSQWPAYPMSGQPDVVLSMDRDDYYAGTLLNESLLELIESYLGVRRTGLLKPEIQLLAGGLYHGLTVASGKQTLGQEYCDLLLARDSQCDIPWPVRVLYSCIHIASPYVRMRLEKGWPR
jgi:Pex2 / Pex12 amino terminal region